MSVIDRLGAALCDLVPRYLSTGVTLKDDEALLVAPSVDYDGLVDAMFHMIRQNGSESTAVMIRMLDVLTSVISCEHDVIRRQTLTRHAELVLSDAIRNITAPADQDAVKERHASFLTMRDRGSLGLLST